MSLPALPRRTAYITLNNPQRRNALSLGELRSLRDQLIKANTYPTTGRLLLLHKLNPPYDWLVSARAFALERAHLPDVLVLASHGPVFSSGHDLRKLRSLPTAEVSETFRLCGEVLSLLRRSPALVVARVSGHALAAGCQLALTADLPLAHAGVRLRLPGAGLGLPCTSPATAVSRRLGNARAWWMVAMAEDVAVRKVRDVVRVVGDGDGYDGKGEEERMRELDCEVVRTVERLVNMSPQQSAMGKWAIWTQAGMTGRDYVGADGVENEGAGAEGYEDAVQWAGRAMALHARSEDAQGGMDAFLEKREPVWRSL